MSQPKILIIDIETAPNLAYVWGMYKQNINKDLFLESTYIMSYAAKWLGNDEVYYEDNRHGDDSVLCESLSLLLSNADYVVAYNGKKFDIPHIQGRMAIHGHTPTSPFKIIDPLLTIKKEFNFPRNNLDYVAEVFGCAKKLEHTKFPGAKLWIQCLKQNDEAWEEMKEYNIQDIVTLEEVYLKVRPWMKQHPNVGVMLEDERAVCPKCGSKHINYRGYCYTNLSKFRKYKCMDCGGWGRQRQNEYDKEKRKQLGTNIA